MIVRIFNQHCVSSKEKECFLVINDNHRMPVSLPNMVVDSVTCDQDLHITPGTSMSVTVGSLHFPDTDGEKKTKMTFSSTGESVFKKRASVQVVTTPTATILESTTILAVDYDGPVTLTLPSGESSIPTGMYIVDEGGFSSETNPITVTSGTGTNGDVTITQPFSSLRVSPNPTGEWFLKKTDTVVNMDGSTTIANEDGSETTTYLDGTVNTVTTDANGNTSYITLSPDGTITVGSTETNGDYSFLATNPDGSTYEEEKNGTLTSTTTVNVDGTSAQTFQFDSGFGIGIERDANGNITSFSFL